MVNTVLCVGQPENPHVQEVVKEIKALDSEAKVVIFNHLAGDSNFIELSGGNLPEPGCVLIANGERIPGDSITSVWFYPKPNMPEDNQNVEGRVVEDFSTKEWGAVLSSLATFLSHARWLNPMSRSTLVNCKPYQLRLAQEVGLTVPKTTVTNNAEAVERLFAEEGRVIFKALTPLIATKGEMVFTREISKEFPSQFAADIAQCPSIFQELVERRSDLRITVVGKKVFPVRIASQRLEEQNDRLDWRRSQDRSDLFSEAQLPEEFKERLLEFHKRAGLVYGAYDFLERGDDKIFLEVNTAGAWLWLERVVGIKVAKSIARYLLGMEP